MNPNPQNPLEEVAVLNRLSILPLPYEDICLDFVIERVSGVSQSQRVRLSDRSYTVWQKGAKEAATDTGLPEVERDFNFASAYKDGAAMASSKSGLQFRIEGIGLMLHGCPYIQTGTDGITSGKVTGAIGMGSDTAISTERHAEYLMNQFLMQTYVKVGAGDEDDCSAIGGLTAFCIFGGAGLADNAASPHFGNNVVGNQRLWAGALINRSGAKDGTNPTLTIVRSDKIDILFNSAVNTADVGGLLIPDATTTHVRQLVTVVALGYTEPLTEISKPA